MSHGIYALVGMQHRDRETGTDISGLVKSLPDGEPLLLIREPTNRIDPNAVQVWARNTHVGFIKASQVAPLARALDAEAARVEAPSTLSIVVGGYAKLSTRNGERWPMVVVED